MDVVGLTVALLSAKSVEIANEEDGIVMIFFQVD